MESHKDIKLNVALLSLVNLQLMVNGRHRMGPRALFVKEDTEIFQDWVTITDIQSQEDRAIQDHYISILNSKIFFLF